MPTNDTLVAIDFGAGIEQGVDPKRVLPTKLIDLQNARLEKGKRISKRYAMRLLTDFKNPVGGTELTADALNTLGPLLLARTKTATLTDAVWSQRETDNSFSLVAAQSGRAASIPNVEIVPITSSTADDNVIVCDSAVFREWTCFASSSSIGVRFVIVNNLTGAQVVSQIGGLSGCKQPRVMTSLFGGFICGFINASNSLEFRFVNPTTDDVFPTSAASSVALASTTQPVWDWATIGSTVCFCYNSSTATTIRYGIVSSTGVASAPGSFTTGGVVNAIAMCDGAAKASDDARIVWHDATAGLQVRYFNASSMAAGTLFGGANRVISATTTTVENIVATVSSNVTIVIAQYTAAATDRRFCIYRAFTDATTIVVSSTITQRALGLASKLVVSNGKVYGLTVFSTPTQAQYFVTHWAGYTGPSGTISNDFAPVAARFLLGDCGGLTSTPHLPQINVSPRFGNGTNVYSVSVLRVGRIFAQGTAFSTIRYVAEARLTLGEARAYQVQAQDSLMLGAGFIGEYDHGWGPIEHGFFMGPELLSVSPQTSGGSLADGVYQYVAFYEWTDRTGKLHRSSVSPAITATVSGGAGAGRVIVTVPNLRVTYKDSALNFGRSFEATVRVVLCRTEDKGKTFYRVNGTPATANNPTADTQTINDTMSNATLVSQEAAYTVGEVNNFTPNGTQAMCRTPDRVFVADGTTIYFSKPFQDGVAVSFSPEFFVSLPTEGGPITALSYQDGRIYAWKRNEAWSFTGDGPDATGAGAAFSVPEKLKIDGGCISQEALADVPSGQIVQTTNGFYQLGRDESWTYIGGAVRDFNTAECISAQVFPERKEVRFLLNGSATVTAGTRLTYNYEFLGPDGIGQWSRATFFAKDSAIVRTDGQNLNPNDIARASTFYYEIGQSNGNVYFEDRSQFTDQLTGDYTLVATTAHIMTSEIQGFQRIKRFLLLGNFKTEATILVEFAYDFGAFSDPRTITASQCTTNGVFEFEIQPAVQKCTAIQIRITITSSGEGVELVSMTFDVGLKPKTNRLPYAKRA